MESTRIGTLLLAALGLVACGDASTSTPLDASTTHDSGNVVVDGGAVEDAAIAPLTRAEFCTQFVALYAQGVIECCPIELEDPADTAMRAGSEICDDVMTGAMWDSGELAFDAAAARGFLETYATEVEACSLDIDGDSDVYSRLRSLVTGSRAAGADCLDPMYEDRSDNSFNFLCAPGSRCATTYPNDEQPRTATCVAFKGDGDVCDDGETSFACADGLACVNDATAETYQRICRPIAAIGAPCSGYNECESGYCDFDVEPSVCAVPTVDHLYCPSFG